MSDKDTHEGIMAARCSERLGLPNGMTLRWGKSDGWYIGQIEEMPDAFSQGRTLDELIHMVQDAKAVLEGDMAAELATFDRGLDDDFVEALNREYAKDGWWRRFVDDPELFVAIRDNRVNVYCRGCSLAELRLDAGEVVGRTHYKYLLRPSLNTPYVEFAEGAYRLPDKTQELLVESPDAVRALKKAARPYAGEEKTGVHRILRSNSNILDVEIAFGLPRTQETDPAAPRVDFAALRVVQGSGMVVFYEAKRFADHKALRAKKWSIPKVVTQIDRYSTLLRDNAEKIAESYGRVCCNLLSLHGMSARHAERHALLEYVSRKPLLIDTEPRLVVFGFDADQRNGAAWTPHRDRLLELLGKKRVLLKGKSKSFRRGIQHGQVIDMEDDHTSATDRMGIGPQVGGEGGFKRRMRLHQSWYRHAVLGVPYGRGSRRASAKYYGNMLDTSAAEQGLNFHSPRIHAVAKARLAESGGLVEVDRLLRNMLSSQPMCFNLFGELRKDSDLATTLARALWGDHVRVVTDVRFEWAPTPQADYLDDKTAFDAIIEYEASDGRLGFIGIETKLTEPFSVLEYQGEKYRRWMTPNAPWRADAGDAVQHARHNQLWRDHLLAWALLSHPASEYGHGRLVVVFHHDDQGTREVIQGYRQLLTDDATLEALDLRAIVSAWRPHAGEWLSEFERRYVDLSGSAGIMSDES